MSSMPVDQKANQKMSSKELASFDPNATASTGVLAFDPGCGLSTESVCDNFKRFGANELSTQKSAGPFLILLRQFQSTVVVLLLIASAISWSTHQQVQACAILAAVLINAAVGFVTEMKAKFSLESLESLAGPIARVKRDGKEQLIPARELVPGDIVILDAGARVPADLILLDSAALSIEESMLSGESLPIYKQHSQGLNEADSEKVYQGTLVLSGRATGEVYATGDNTKLGQLGVLLRKTESGRTPLELQLEKLGQQLTWLTIVLCVLLLLVGILYKIDLWHMLQTSVALAVAAIPEGMPVVATLALAAGTRRMVKEGALIRELAAVETLGCTTVICSDKTGTLTENQMLVTDLILPERHLKVTGQGYEPRGEILENGAKVPFSEDKFLMTLLHTGALCNDARLEKHDGESSWHIHGDPTEGAILTAARKLGIEHEQINRDNPRIFELPFDLQRKRMSSIHRNDKGEIFSCTKGSPGTILGLAKYVATADGIRSLSDEDRKWFAEKNDELAGRGLRVLAVGMATLHERQHTYEAEDIERNLTLLGLIGMADQARAGAAEAVASCRDAGIRVIMVTGDQPATAAAIAKTLKILDDESSSKVFTGSQLEAMSDLQLAHALKDAQVLARVNPELKLKVVKTLQNEGEIVAMTGDGVNDAPALRQADIGVAMGLSGTALAREASKMVITDDNFASIVKAVAEGRVIYANIRQAIAYLLTASFSSVFAVFGTVLAGEGNQFSPLLLLWLNLIMHIFPGLAVVLQPAPKKIMSQPPRNSKENLLSTRIQIQIAIRSLVVAINVLISMFFARKMEFASVSTIGFAVLSLSLLLQALSWSMAQRGARLSQLKSLCNRPMMINMAASVFLLVLAIYYKPLQLILGTAVLAEYEVVFVLAASMISFFANEIIQILIKVKK